MVWFRRTQEVFLVFKSSRPVLGPTDTPAKCLLWYLSPGVKNSEVDVTTHIQLLKKLRMRGAMPTLMACTSVIPLLICVYK